MPRVPGGSLRLAPANAARVALVRNHESRVFRPPNQTQRTQSGSPITAIMAASSKNEPDSGVVTLAGYVAVVHATLETKAAQHPWHESVRGPRRVDRGPVRLALLLSRSSCPRSRPGRRPRRRQGKSPTRAGRRRCSPHPHQKGNRRRLRTSYLRPS